MGVCRRTVIPEGCKARTFGVFGVAVRGIDLSGIACSWAYTHCFDYCFLSSEYHYRGHRCEYLSRERGLSGRERADVDCRGGIVKNSTPSHMFKPRILVLTVETLGFYVTKCALMFYLTSSPL